MDGVVSVVLGVRSPQLAQEVVHFLDRTGRSRAVATAADAESLLRTASDSRPDVVVAEAELMTDQLRDVARSVLVVETSESVGALRRALEAGARGYFVWPDERAALAHALEVAAQRPVASGPTGRVIAVIGARGGAGATFLATHLAQALARAERRTVLIDLDPGFPGLANALDVSEQERPSLADLLPVMGELAAEHVREVLWRHEAKFEVVLPPPIPATGALRTIDLVPLIDVLRSESEFVVVDLPRWSPSLEEVTASASSSVAVLNLDVASFLNARRLLELIPTPADVQFVVNKAVRAEIVPGDVERVLGRRAVSVIGHTRAIARAQERGRLLTPRSAVGRRIQALAERLAAEPVPEEVAA